MPNINKHLSTLKHPNSRKTKALTKQIAKATSREKNKLAQQMKQNVIGEKVAWFKDHLSVNCSCYSAIQTEELILKYLSRFDNELEQITIKNSIGQRKQRQHANREDIIKLTIKREHEEYNTCGLEIPDIMNIEQLHILRNWNGELRFLQNIKLRRISKKFLQMQKVEESKSEVKKDKTKLCNSNIMET